MAPAGALSSPVPAAILFTCFLLFFFLSTASSSQAQAPTAPPIHSNASDSDFQALLCLKMHLSPSGNAGAMASWGNDSALPYCSWPGVTCSKRHEYRVAALALESLDLRGQIPSCVGNLTLLTSIHLPNNGLVGNIPPELGHLHRLTYLNLSYNKLAGAIPSTLSSCSQLRIVDLASNSLDGEIPSSLTKCSSLQEIYMYNNNLHGVIPEGLGTLSNLSVLFLASNNLTGSIPFSLGGSPSLKIVILTNNTLAGGIPPLLANSSSLEWLDLTNTRLSGQIPPALFNSPSLRFMDLGVNNFVGSIPPISNISSPLEYLILSQNNLSGIIPSSLGNLSSLLWLHLSENNFQGTIPSSLSTIPNLQELDMTYNNLSGIVPSSLYNMSMLTYLGIGKNSLIGEIPSYIGYTLPSIEALILEGNRFQGQVPPSLAYARNLQFIHLRDNAFSGIIPSFGSLSNLTELDLGKNRLEAGNWSFLSSLTNCSQLALLRLDRNILEGVLPNSIAHLSKSLEILLLSSNKISGTIPEEIGHLTNLAVLQMEQNLLSGNLPESLGNLSNLYVLSLSRNKLSGQIPLSIGKLSQLSELYFEENNLNGPIPASLGGCKSLGKLNLSCNNFVGSIPKELFMLSSLSEGLDLSHNQLSGQIPLEIGHLINLSPLNISNNQLSGQIPTTLGECVHLESLHMEGNHLDGRIPESFIALRGIIEMDLSRNNLSGEIPRFFESFSYMKLFNLSFNNLEGTVPTNGIFQNESEVFIQGNEKLCTSNPLLHVTLCNVERSKERHTSKLLKIVEFSALGLIPLLFITIIISKKRKKAKKETHQPCKEFMKFSYTDLVKATNGFSLVNLVGSGKYGSVYKGKFEFDEHVVAIKVFKLDQLGAPKSFCAECEALRNTRHRNLVRVITACSTYNPAGHEFKALILEYMANGNLESWLYPKHLKRPLSLGSRIKVATDIASALDYLHNHCSPPIVHCDLKPSNILLDNVMDAHVGDFGLAKFVRNYSSSRNNTSTSLLGPGGSIGYIAPEILLNVSEYGFGRKVSVEGDVYSYGIIILEMLTGKCPTNEMFNNGLDLHKFVRRAFSQNIIDVLDPVIVPSYEGENYAMVRILNCIRRLVKLGLSCCMETPKDRSKMQDAYAEITAIKEAFSALQG